MFTIHTLHFSDFGELKVYCKIENAQCYIILWLMRRKSLDMSFVPWLQTIFLSAHPEWRSSVWSFKWRIKLQPTLYLWSTRKCSPLLPFAVRTEMFTRWAQPCRVCTQLYKATGDSQVCLLETLCKYVQWKAAWPWLSKCEYNFPSFLLHMNHFITPSLHPSVLSYFNHLTAWQLLLPSFAVIRSICWSVKKKK